MPVDEGLALYAAAAEAAAARPAAAGGRHVLRALHHPARRRRPRGRVPSPSPSTTTAAARSSSPAGSTTTRTSSTRRSAGWTRCPPSAAPCTPRVWKTTSSRSSAGPRRSRRSGASRSAWSSSTAATPTSTPTADYEGWAPHVADGRAPRHPRRVPRPGGRRPGPVPRLPPRPRLRRVHRGLGDATRCASCAAPGRRGSLSRAPTPGTHRGACRTTSPSYARAAPAPLAVRPATPARPLASPRSCRRAGAAARLAGHAAARRRPLRTTERRRHGGGARPPPCRPSRPPPHRCPRSLRSHRRPRPRPRPRARPRRPLTGKVVVIDPGHNPQPRAHARDQPPGGHRHRREGVRHHRHGHQRRLHRGPFTLDVVHRLRDPARRAGRHGEVHAGRRPRRSGPCVDERARIGNKAHADAVVSVHADGSAAGNRGFHVILPAPVHGGRRGHPADRRPLPRSRRAHRAATSSAPPAARPPTTSATVPGWTSARISAVSICPRFPRCSSSAAICATRRTPPCSPAATGGRKRRKGSLRASAASCTGSARRRERQVRPGIPSPHDRTIGDSSVRWGPPPSFAPCHRALAAATTAPTRRPTKDLHVNIRSLTRGDGVVIGAAVLLFIASFLDLTFDCSGGLLRRRAERLGQRLGLLLGVYLAGHHRRGADRRRPRAAAAAARSSASTSASSAPPSPSSPPGPRSGRSSTRGPWTTRQLDAAPASSSAYRGARPGRRRRRHPARPGPQGRRSSAPRARRAP